MENNNLIPIGEDLKVGDVVYTKDGFVMDIGLVKSVSPLKIYTRYFKFDGAWPVSEYGRVEHCRWYNSNINLSVEDWRTLTFDKSTEAICKELGIAYRGETEDERRIKTIAEQKEEEKKKRLISKAHQFLTENKISYEVLIRSVNFFNDMATEERGILNKAYKDGEFKGHGWY